MPNEISKRSMYQLLSKDYGRWGKRNSMLKHPPCGKHDPYKDATNMRKTLASENACAVCIEWLKQEQTIISAWRFRHRNPSETKIVQQKLPRPTIVVTRSKLIDLPTFELGKTVVRDPALQGYIYVLIHPLRPEWVKIGSTVNLSKRLSSYQTGDPFREYEIVHYVKVDDRIAIEQWVLFNLQKQYDRKNEWMRCGAETAILSVNQSIEYLGINIVSNNAVEYCESQ